MLVLPFVMHMQDIKGMFYGIDEYDILDNTNGLYNSWDNKCSN